MRRSIVLAALAASASVLAAPARSEDPPLLTVSTPFACLRLLPLELCPSGGSPPDTEPAPAAVTSTSVRYDSRGMLVRFQKGTARSTIQAALTRAGVEVVRTLPAIRLHFVKAEEGHRDQALESLRRETSVEEVEREILVDALDTTPNDPAWPEQWGLRIAGFPKAWDVTQGSRKVVVAVLDTGVERSHPDLRNAVVPGYDFVNGDTDAGDDHGHGTAVAGVLAARGNNAIGVAGGCWSCTVLPVKVLGSDGTGSTATVAAGIIWAADHGAQVINLSLGAPGTTVALSDAVAYASRKNAVLVAAAGNSGSTTPFYPAADGAVIGVAGSNQSDELYAWSNRGAWVLVAAPGCNSTLWRGGTYVSFCGTSAATPLVAGLAALVRSASPDATGEETVDAVKRAVAQVGAEVRHGRVNAALALPHRRPFSKSGKARRTVSFRGRLGPRTRFRTFRRAVGPGRLTAILRFGDARSLSLSLLGSRRPVARVSGRSPLRLTRIVSAGAVKLVVRSRGRRASFRLTMTYTVPRAHG